MLNTTNLRKWFILGIAIVSLSTVTFAAEQEEVTDNASTIEQTIETKEPEKSKGEQVVEYAKQFIGTPYQYGGTDLHSGVDCSGFTKQIYTNFGIQLQRTSRDQYASNGTKVTKEELEAGDLVFYGVDGRVRHVAIYVGDGQIIHAPSYGQGVRIAPLHQRGDDPIIGYKRVIA